ncbi:FHA domain protein [Teladorsagia circumcincta]|uniref:FHA domain protein n=1 Tax=Teladorsagia circumcincta TaxID=45464 RepID=A0A2G9UM42_TELCI|nr:FHA domain protein [Teladorsagia circumcincta]
MSIVHPELHYTPPPWASVPEPGQGYKLEVVKNGTIVGYFDLDIRKHSTFVVIGRLPNCDVILDHPSISRYHCILQYGEDPMDRTGKGWHIYDMGSTHGSKANKKKVPAKQYMRIMILESKLAMAARKELEAEKAKEAEASEGIDWGMGFDEDYTPGVELEMDGHLMEDREQYYEADPKKALAKFFEREGFDMKFDLTEQGSGHTHKWLCTIESSNAKARAKRNELEENDFYDEDDDEYLDRTGQIERQREKRMMWAKNKTGGSTEKKSTYESLCKELEETRENIVKLKAKLDELHTAQTSTNTGDSLDDYCRQLNEGHGVVPDMKAKTETSQLRQKLVALTHDAQRLEKLVKIAKPVALPELKVAGTNTCGADKQAFLRKMMMVGRKKVEESKPAASEEGSSMKGPAGMPSSSEPFKPEVEADDEEKIFPEVAPQPASVASRADEQISEEISLESSPSSKLEKRAPRELKANEPQPSARAASDDMSGESTDERKVEKRSLSGEAENSNEAAKKKRRVRVRGNRPSTEAGEDYGNGIDDDRYATWLPPDNQSGDGKTALNAKFEGRY